MDAIETIMTRRSIRAFMETAVDESAVEVLLRAAMAAPSAGNQKPWHFVVVRDRKLLGELAGTSPYAAPLRNAPLGVVICGDTAGEAHPGFWVQDCSAATENLLLAAHSRGLGAVWLGYHPREERAQKAQKVLGLPRTMIPLSIVAVGWPAEEKKPADRYESSRVHFDRW